MSLLVGGLNYHTCLKYLNWCCCVKRNCGWGGNGRRRCCLNFRPIAVIVISFKFVGVFEFGFVYVVIVGIIVIVNISYLCFVVVAWEMGLAFWAVEGFVLGGLWGLGLNCIGGCLRICLILFELVLYLRYQLPFWLVCFLFININIFF